MPRNYSAIFINKSSSKCGIVGSQNVLQSTLRMTYENFLEQVNLAEQLTTSDFGVATGLIHQGYWEMSKGYFVNVERGNIADKLQPKNKTISLNNNSDVTIDLLVFLFYSDQTAAVVR